MKGYFVTGTDTNVGKTVITSGLTAVFNRRLSKLEKFEPVIALKPIESGAAPIPQDATQLMEINSQTAKVQLALSDICCIQLKTAVAPAVAARIEGVEICLKEIASHIKNISQKHERILVEGAGGVAVPLTEHQTNLDLIHELGLPALVVARGGLGTINHTVLTVSALRQRGVIVAGIILNHSSQEDRDESISTNRAEIEKLTGVSVVGEVPYLTSYGLEFLANTIEQSIDIDLLLDRMGTPASGKSESIDSTKSIWYPFTQMTDFQKEKPLLIKGAQGNWLIDDRGNRYLDGNSSLWVNLHGHCHPKIVSAIQDQVAKLDHSTLLGLANEPATLLSEKLVKLSPSNLKRVFYSDSGSTGVEIALKMAYQYRQLKGEDQKKKTKFISLKNAYHGDTVGSVSVGGMGLFHETFKNLLFDVIHVEPGNIEELQATIKSHHTEVTAMIVEPLIQGAAGMLTYPSDYLKAAETLCKNNDILFIVDEVATGFGRTGKMFAVEHAGVKPDLMIVAKGITGGTLPLAATLATEEIFDVFLGEYSEYKTFFHGHSYTGNPIACRAALASLEIFEEQKVLECLQPKIEKLENWLKKAAELPGVIDVRQCGMMAGIELGPYPVEKRMAAIACRILQDHGIILRPLGNVMVFVPPLSILREELDYLMESSLKAIEKVVGDDRS